MIVRQDSSGSGELSDVTGQQQRPSQALVRKQNTNIIVSEKKHLSEKSVAILDIQVSNKGKIRTLSDTKQGVSDLPELVPASSSTVSTDSVKVR